MEEIRLTDVSVSVILSCSPRAPVDDMVPFMVDPRHEIERVIKKNNDVPEWIRSPKTPHVRMTYTSALHSVDCHIITDTLTCSGIKYDNIREFCENDLDKILRILDVEQVSSFMLFKAQGIAKISNPWSRVLFADVVTNNPRVSRSIALSEVIGTIGSKRLLSLVVDLNGVQVRAVVTPKSNTGIVVKMSRLPYPEAAAVVMSALKESFEIYDDEYDALLEVYGDLSQSIDINSTSRDHTLQGIEELRQELPELFVNNYTRECPILPIMVNEALEGVIFYPKDSTEYGRYYAAPPGYFVGLKKNRLDNADKFPYLVTCYTSDHMLRKNSDTYKYYSGTEDSRIKAFQRPVPRSISGVIQDTSYSRVGVGITPNSFVRCLEKVTRHSIDQAKLPWAPQLVRQENWEQSDEYIMDMIRNPDTYLSGSLMYRYFEELLKISIHVVVVNNGKFGDILPKHVPPYVWAPPYDGHVVIFESKKKTYGKEYGFHEILMLRKDKSMVFNSDNRIVSRIIEEKQKISIIPVHLDNEPKYQLLDSEGKCRVIRMCSSTIITFTRPLAAPVIEPPSCFFDNHITKMNDIKVAMGLAPIELYKRSTRDIIYFPNDRSFKEWMRKGSL